MIRAIKKMTLSALIFGFWAFFLLSSGIIRVNADSEYYTLYNLLPNGDFSADSNSDGLADYYNKQYSTASITTNGQKLTSNATSYYIEIFNGGGTDISWNLNHKYYYRLDYNVNATYTPLNLTISTVLGGSYRIINNTDVSVNKNGTASGIWENTFATGVYRLNCNLIKHYSANLTVNDYYEMDNYILIDLTDTFGPGNEPSLADFELYYLPADFFSVSEKYYNGTYIQDIYRAYIPKIYEEVSSSQDLGEDNTLIDWTTCMIGKNGKNINLTLNMYLDYVGESQSYEFLEIGPNIPDLEIYYYGVLYQIPWVQSDDDYHLYTLNTDYNDLATTALYSVLFDRAFTDNYISFYVGSFIYEMDLLYAEFTPRYWIDITTDFVYNVNIGSVIVSQEQDNLNETCPLNSLWAKFYDSNGDIVNPSMQLTGLGDAFGTFVFDDFYTQYNNISSFRLAFDLITYDYSDAYPYYDLNIYEINVFASDTVLLVNPPVDDVADLFPITVVEWYDIGGQLKNLFNEVAGAVYEFLHIAEIVASFQGFFDAVNDIIDFLPPSIKSIAQIVTAMATLGLLVVVAEKFL